MKNKVLFDIKLSASKIAKFAKLHINLAKK